MALLLLVEDDPDIAYELRDWLCTTGHTVEFAVSGPEALDHLEYNKYDVIIMDGQLPAMDGQTVARIYRSAGGATPIVMMTGRTREESLDGCIAAGANAFLEKPFELEDLSAAIDRMIKEPDCKLF